MLPKDKPKFAAGKNLSREQPTQGQNDSFDAALDPSTSLLRLHPACPRRPPDWRWQLGLHLARCDNPLFSGWADDDVRAAADLAADLRRHPGDAGRLEVARRHPAGLEALTVWCRQPPLSRWEVEARLLAGEPREAIASKTGLSLEVLGWCENWFFDVRSRLPHEGYITHHAVRLHRVEGEPDLGVAWRHCGYFGGPAALDALLDDFRRHVPPGDPDPTAAYLRGDGRLASPARVWVLYQLAPVTPANASKWTWLSLLQHELADLRGAASREAEAWRVSSPGSEEADKLGHAGKQGDRSETRWRTPEARNTVNWE
jgi:hypothetical protein